MGRGFGRRGLDFQAIRGIPKEGLKLPRVDKTAIELLVVGFGFFGDTKNTQIVQSAP